MSKEMIIPPPSTARKQKSVGVRKQRCELDRKEEPIGKMEDVFCRNVYALAREMNPSVGWKEQTEEDRMTLEDRVYNEWELYGDSFRVSLKYLKAEVGKAFITLQHGYMKLIDAGEKKPLELSDKYWELLNIKRKKLEEIEKSIEMTRVAKQRGARNSIRLKLEKATLVRLVRDYNNNELENCCMQCM
jgi:hypothetical protein